MHEWDAATAKAKDLVRMSVMRASLLEPLQEISIDIFPASCIIGAGIAGMTAALSIAAQGYDVYLVEKEAEVGGMLRGLDSLTPTNADPAQIIASYLKGSRRLPTSSCTRGRASKPSTATSATSTSRSRWETATRR